MSILDWCRKYTLKVQKYVAAMQPQLSGQFYMDETEIDRGKGNATRFFILSKTPAKMTAHTKTSLVFSTAHRPGALFRCLEGFAGKNINLTKLVSRPMKNTKWEYVFYLDFEGGTADPAALSALETLKQNAQFIRILGSYPRTN